MDRPGVQAWLDSYVDAWVRYDPEAIGDLFSEDATYGHDPFAEPIRGRPAIVASWLADRDPPGTYSAHYEPVAVDGDVAIANGRSRYVGEDGSVREEFGNVFLLRFDDRGRCCEFTEWYMARREGS
jgi:ketosteroid isomerase-like protein